MKIFAFQIEAKERISFDSGLKKNYFQEQGVKYKDFNRFHV